MEPDVIISLLFHLVSLSTTMLIISLIISCFMFSNLPSVLMMRTFPANTWSTATVGPSSTVHALSSPGASAGACWVRVRYEANIYAVSLELSHLASHGVLRIDNSDSPCLPPVCLLSAPLCPQIWTLQGSRGRSYILSVTWPCHRVLIYFIEIAASSTPSSSQWPPPVLIHGSLFIVLSVKFYAKRPLHHPPSNGRAK